MIIEALKELGQMIQGHPEAQAKYKDQVSDLRRSVNNLTEIQQSLKSKGLSDPQTNTLLAQQKAKLALITGESH